MKLIFLDRDGVINKYPGDFEYVKSWQEFEFLPGIEGALKNLSDAGFKIYVASNQAGVSKGIYNQETLDAITKNMLSELKKRDVFVSGVNYCTHRPEDNCTCRKPKTGMVDSVISDLTKKGITVDIKNSYFIGDTIRDIETGKKAGLKTILVFSGKEKAKNKNQWGILPDFTAEDLPRAAKIILN